MQNVEAWKLSLRAFFDQRGLEIQGVPTISDLCYVSGRDPRIWGHPEIQDELATSIIDLGAITPSSAVIEVGCASGFLASIIAPRVGRYTGVDLAPQAVQTARRLAIPNATFGTADGAHLPFQDGSFDAVLCLHVLNNLPNFAAAAPIIAEMLRVTKPGGRVVVGAVPDVALMPLVADCVERVAAEADARYGPLKPRNAPMKADGAIAKVARKLGMLPPAPCVQSYYFRREDFIDLGRRLNSDVTMSAVHPRDPFGGLRFNVVFEARQSRPLFLNYSAEPAATFR
jgi:SAM-dependent methyltransferase